MAVNTHPPVPWGPLGPLQRSFSSESDDSDEQTPVPAATVLSEADSLGPPKAQSAARGISRPSKVRLSSLGPRVSLSNTEPVRQEQLP